MVHFWNTVRPRVSGLLNPHPTPPLLFDEDEDQSWRTVVALRVDPSNLEHHSSEGYLLVEFEDLSYREEGLVDGVRRGRRTPTRTEPVVFYLPTCIKEEKERLGNTRGTEVLPLRFVYKSLGVWRHK